MTTRTSKFFARLVSLLMCVMLIVSVVPTYAVETTSPFDFSAEDALDKYDTYTKSIANGNNASCSLPDGTEYVSAAMYNDFNSSDPKPVGNFRYSAFLRTDDEVQHYIFFNQKDRTLNKNMPSNVLTIYADPGVEFEVRDNSGALIADQDGLKNVAIVTYFNASLDNGHNVFYMELEGQEPQQSSTSVTFKGPQTTEPAHYSFWFGAPLLVSGSTAPSRLVLFATKGSTSSSPFTIPIHISTGNWERTWVKSVSVRKTYFESPDNCSSVSLSLRLPGEKSSKSISIRSSQNVTFEAKVNSILSSTLVDGDYEFQLTGIRWLSNPVSPYMDYQGMVTINYYTAFGY